MSIKKKLVLVVFSIIIGFMVTLLVINSLFLEKYYVYALKSDFEADAVAIKDIYLRDRNIRHLIKEKDSDKGYKYSLVNEKGDIILTSVPEFRQGDKTPLPSHIFDYLKLISDDLDLGDIKYAVMKHPQKDQDQIILFYKLEKDHYLMITDQLKDVRGNTLIANQFFLMSGFSVVLVVLLITYILSNRLVHPIVHLNEQSKKIASFDFDIDINQSSNDEIGQLGDNIKSIARALDQKIQALETANNSLEEDMSQQRQFLASVAHEFKSPIGIIKGYTESVKLNYYENDDEKQIFLNYVLEESDRLTSLVEDIVMLAQIDKRDFVLKKTDVDLSHMLKDLVNKYDKEAAFETRISDSIIVNGDPKRLGQVISNLLSNAINYSKEVSDIKVSLEKDQNKVLMTVTNPAEFSKDQLLHLTRPFYRLEESRSRTTGGHGLGLTIVKGLIDAHGGQLKLMKHDHLFIAQVVL